MPLIVKNGMRLIIKSLLFLIIFCAMMKAQNLFHETKICVKGMDGMRKRQWSGFYHKKWCVMAVVCMMAVTLCGCGGKYPDLSEEQEQAVVKYAAALLYENDQNRASRLMTEEEMILAMQRRAAHAYVAPTPIPEEGEDKEHSDGQGTENPSENEPVVETRTLAEFFGFSGIDISYQGYFLTKSYPEESGDELYFAMDALTGNELLLLQYTITNLRTEAAQVDILDLKPRFRLFINDGGQINAMSTLLLDDMKTTNCTLQPGESSNVVVVFEVTEEEAASIQGLRLTVKTEEDSWTVELLQTGETVSYDGENGSGETDSFEAGMPVLSYMIPEEFVEQGDGVYFAPDYPNDSANIVVVSSDYDPETFQLTQESYCEAMADTFTQIYGLETIVDCTEFVESEINGYRTRLIRMTWSVQDMEFEQIQFAVETGQNKTTVITYSQSPDGVWTDAFNESIDSVRIENEG